MKRKLSPFFAAAALTALSLVPAARAQNDNRASEPPKVMNADERDALVKSWPVVVGPFKKQDVILAVHRNSATYETCIRLSTPAGNGTSCARTGIKLEDRILVDGRVSLREKPDEICVSYTPENGENAEKVEACAPGCKSVWTSPPDPVENKSGIVPAGPA